MRRTAGGRFEPCSWDEAFALVDAGLRGVLERSGGDRDAIAAYLGNPSAHSLSALVYGRVLLKALGTRNVFSAGSVDQIPKQLASALMFGGPLTVAVPDLDRTDHLLVLGANPLTSNGSLMTAPDVRGRLRRIRARGGRVVVVDPRRTRTAQAADEHVPIRPGTDALLLMAMVATLFEEGLVAPGRLAGLCDGIEEVRALAAPFAPERVAGPTGIPAGTIRRLARELAAAPRAVVYGRMGTTTQAFGTTASWLVDVLNVLTGNLDREGGAMFPRPATGDGPRRARMGRWRSRVRGRPEVFGELPAACLAEEIDTPGDGQVRALIALAGNPVVSTPNARRLERALASLDLMVAVDLYVTETTRHADVILPAPSPLERAHYDLALSAFAVRDVANYSPPTLPLPDGMPDEWETLLRLAGIAAGQGPDPNVAALDDLVAAATAQRLGVPPEALAGRRGPERILDAMLRAGPDDLTLADLEAAPHGIDLGPLRPRLPELLSTEDGRIRLAPEPLAGDVARLRAALEDARAGTGREDGGLLLVGRRDLRSNNSWMHNLPLLVSGPARCTVQVHPDDAARLGLADGARARVRSAVGEIELPVEVTDAVMAGVVSIPHGWGHDADGVGWATAARHAGANSNVLSDEQAVEPVSGTAILNGIPVTLAPLAGDGAPAVDGRGDRRRPGPDPAARDQARAPASASSVARIAASARSGSSGR